MTTKPKKKPTGWDKAKRQEAGYVYMTLTLFAEDREHLRAIAAREGVSMAALVTRWIRDDPFGKVPKKATKKGGAA